ncbi:MAG: polysaccharide deacetylase family protein [Steroidobacterales bacterium]
MDVMGCPRLAILTYHNVDQPPVRVKYRRLYVTPRQFTAQMTLLRRLGIEGVSLSEGLRRLRSGDRRACVALTFDDGYADNLLHAAPVLRRFGFGATCFVVSDCIGTYNVWDAELLGTRKRLMNAAELAAWLAHGFEIGSHTRSHPRLHELDEKRAFEEIAASRSALQALIDQEVEHFCYPFGECNDALAALVQRAGYRTAVSCRRGRATAADDPYLLPRVSIGGGRSLIKFLLKVATPYADVGRKAVQ